MLIVVLKKCEGFSEANGQIPKKKNQASSWLIYSSRENNSSSLLKGKSLP